MNISARGGVSRGLAFTALAAGSLLLAPTAATAAPAPAPVAGAATYKSAGTGWDGVIDGRAAGTNVLATAGGDLETFCIQYHVPGATDGSFKSVTWPTGFSGKAADVAVRHNAIAGKLADQRSENAAAQLAIWHLTDNVDHSTVPNAQIVARADQILAAAQDVAPVNGSFDVQVAAQTGKAASGEAQTTVTVTVLEADGDPAVAVPVSLEPDNAIEGLSAPATAVTGTDGVATLVFAGSATDNTADVTIEPTIAAGAVWVPEDDKQLVVATKATKLSLMAAADVTLPAVTPEPVVTPTPDPTTPAAVPVADPTTPAAAPEKPTVPPHTGALAPASAVLALLVLAGGAAWRAVTLRRRNA